MCTHARTHTHTHTHTRARTRARIPSAVRYTHAYRHTIAFTQACTNAHISAIRLTCTHACAHTSNTCTHHDVCWCDVPFVDYTSVEHTLKMNTVPNPFLPPPPPAFTLGFWGALQFCLAPISPRIFQSFRFSSSYCCSDLRRIHECSCTSVLHCWSSTCRHWDTLFCTLQKTRRTTRMHTTWKKTRTCI